jgi:hypothetical protein
LKAIREEGVSFPSAKDLQTFAKEQGLSTRIEIQHLAIAASLLEKDDNEKIVLSQKGEIVTSLKSNLQADIVHFFLYVAWRFNQPEQNSFLWSYREVVDSYWDQAIVNVVETANLIAEEINNRTQTIFSGVDGYNLGEVSFSPKSIRGVRKWLEALTPPVIENDIFTRRNFCPPELTLLVLGWVAKLMDGEIGIDFLLTPPRREAICRLCLIELNDLDSVLDWMLPNYAEIVQPGTSAGVYGRYLRFLKWPEISDLI